MKLVEALEARGVALIDSVEKRPDPVIVPWDALSAAAFWGHIDLVRRWLPDAPHALAACRFRPHRRHGREFRTPHQAHGVHRAFQLAREFEPDAFARDFLDDSLARRAAKASGEAATAVTLIGVTADGSLLRGTPIPSTLNAGLLREIDATPGLIALTREQLAPLVQEQALGAPGGLWGSAWMIEGGVRALERQGNVSLTMRVTSATSGETHDVTVDGSDSDPRDLVTRAWCALRETLDFAESRMHDDPERAQREAARLAREAEWLLNSPLAVQAAPLADAAFYLGGPTPDTLMLRLNADWARSPILPNPRSQWGGYSSDPVARGFAHASRARIILQARPCEA